MLNGEVSTTHTWGSYNPGTPWLRPCYSVSEECFACQACQAHRKEQAVMGYRQQQP
uniref:Uncharacterized protein n=1 Tax=Meloidogyne enterolobii TaxID=390850 RepID=A0A6V7U5F8_MELEN|nr:unnamed protein product [Meloidogyne enterolobii]